MSRSLGFIDPADLLGRRRAQRRIWRRAFLASVLAHVLVFLFWQGDRVPISPFTAAGPEMGDARAAPGGMAAIQLRAFVEVPPQPVVPIPVPQELPVEPEPEPEILPELEPPPEVTLEVAEVPGESEVGNVGTGTSEAGEAEGADGAGEGAGGSDLEGTAGIVPPTLRGMVMPPTNRNLRGETIEVWVFVDVAGQVVSDSTLLRPPTRDRDYNRRLIREAAQWVFEPARRDGEAVGAWFPYIIQL
ncbi:MAG: hypothetical protein WEA09_01065 [Gemmatimonadota bacterium]